jgi:hypothetical protein
MAGGTLKFKKPTARIPLAGSSSEGLRGNKVRLSGNKKKAAPKRAASDDDDSDGDGPVSFPSFPARAKAGAKAGAKAPAPRSDARLSQFDKLVNASKVKKAAAVQRASAPPPVRSGGLRSVAVDMPASRAPAQVSDSDSGSDSGSEGSDSDSDSGAGGFDESNMSMSSGASGADVPLDDSLSIISGPPPPRGGARGGGRGAGFGGLTSEESEGAEKSDLLARFHLLKQRGVRVSKPYTVKSSLNEMRLEMGRIEHEAQVAQSIKVNRRVLMAGVSAFESLTDSYGPGAVRGKFHRVSHYVSNSIKDYDGAFESMAEHYGGVIGAVTGGNPLYEIGATLVYQMIMYAAFYRGAENAKANEELTVEEIKRKFPQLVEEAARRMLAEHGRVAQEGQQPQQPQQPQYAAPAAPFHVAPGPAMAGPSMDADAYLEQMMRQQQRYDPPQLQQQYQPQQYQPQYQQQQHYAPQMPAQLQQMQQMQPRHLNAEGPIAPRAPAAAMPAPGGGYAPAAGVNALISEMHRPLPHVSYEAQREQDEYDESVHFGGPPNALSTRSGRATDVLGFVPAEGVPLPEEDDGDDLSGGSLSGGDSDEEVVIDIK